MKEPLPLQPWAFELRKRMDEGKDNPDAHCLPISRSTAITAAAADHQTPRSAGVLLRQRRHPADLQRTAAAIKRSAAVVGSCSTGRWEGDALVVQTSASETEAGSYQRAAHRCGEVDERLARELRQPRDQIPWTIRRRTEAMDVKIDQSVMLDTDLIGSSAPRREISAPFRSKQCRPSGLLSGGYPYKWISSSYFSSPSRSRQAPPSQFPADRQLS
jgi:hypothetical protein